MPPSGSSPSDSADTVLSLDVGSSSVRASLFDTAGTLVPGSPVRERQSLHYTDDGGAELDPRALADRVVHTIDGAVAAARAGGRRIVAVGADTLWHSVCGVDARGEVTVPILTWAERRPGPAAAALREQLDPRAYTARTGAHLHPSYVPAKVRWFAEAHPQRYAQTSRFLSPGEYVYAQLLEAEPTTALSMASGTGLFSQQQLTWDAETLSAVGLDAERLPAISDEPARGLRPQFARRWPELADVPWYPAIGDGAASNVGTGAVSHRHVAVMVGTSGAMRVLCAARPGGIPPGLWCYRLDERRHLLGGALNNGGNLIAWLRSTLQLPPLDEAETQLVDRPPGAHGLTMLPLLAGERAPGWTDFATGTVTGLTMSTTPLDVLHATMESVALRFAMLATLLRTALPDEPFGVIATGGGLRKSPLWRRILADALNHPVSVSAVDEASSRGTALVVLERLGLSGPLEDVRAPVGDVVEPDPARAERYAELLAEQVALYERFYGDLPGI